MPSLSNRWNEEDRRAFRDRNILKAQTVPPADKPAPTVDEWDDLGWDDEPLEPMSCNLENPESCESCQ